MQDNPKNMSAPLIMEFTYEAPRDKVWRTLTELNSMKKWYFPQLQEFEPVVGFEFQFVDSNDTYQKKWVVTKIDKPNTFAHNWSYKGYKGESEVTFDLLPADDGTRVRVTHTGLDTFPDDSHFARERFEWGWNNLLGKNLKALVERN